MTKVRPATRADLPQILPLGKLMHAESRYSSVPFSPIKVSATFAALIDGQGCVFVAEKDGEIIGGIAGFLGPVWFGIDQTLMELTLFLKPECRGGTLAARLIKAFVAFGREQGCTLIQSGVVSGVEQERTEKLYQRLGGKLHGSLYEFGEV